MALSTYFQSQYPLLRHPSADTHEPAAFSWWCNIAIAKTPGPNRRDYLQPPIRLSYPQPHALNPMSPQHHHIVALTDLHAP